RFYEEGFGYEFGPLIERKHAGAVTRIGVLSGNRLQLMAPDGPDNAISRFLDSRGEGLYAVVYSVEDIEDELRRKSEKGPPPISTEVTELAEFREFLIHPRDTFGVLTVIRQWR